MASLLQPDYLAQTDSTVIPSSVLLSPPHDDPPDCLSPIDYLPADDPPPTEATASRVVATSVIAGENLTRSKPVFSADAKYVFICCANVVRVFVNATGEVLRDLRGHSDLVTSVCLDPQNRFQIYSSSFDGSICLWDYEDGLLLKKFPIDASAIVDKLRVFVPRGVLGVFMPSKAVEADGRPSAFVLISRKEPEPEPELKPKPKSKESLKTKSLYFLRGPQPRPNDRAFVLNEVLMGNVNPRTKGENLNAKCTDVSSEGQLIASIRKGNKSMTLYVHDVKRAKTHRIKNKNERMSCVSCHPHLPMVVVGCFNGKILVINNVDTDACTRVVYHWHSLPVQAVAFSRDGTHFLSGGHECVLVRWNLSASGERQFVPRLGAAIEKIALSPDNDFFALSMSDNSVNVFGSTRMKTAVFQGMVRYPFKRAVEGAEAGGRKAKGAKAGGRNVKGVEATLVMEELGIPARIRASAVPTGLHRDPRTNHLVLNGHLGQIQFFDVTQNRLVQSIDVLNLNFVSPDSIEGAQILAEVKLIALDARGEWLVTVEQWKTGEISQQLRLKVWRRPNKSSANFSLHTVVNKPHTEEITQVAFRPYVDPNEGALFATTSLDGKFKLWTYEEDEDDGAEGEKREGESKVSYWANDLTNSFQNQTPVDLDFSEDGSVVGVAFGRYLTLWTTEACELKDSHMNPDPADSTTISKVLFGLGDCSHLVVYATAEAIIVYDVLTLGVSWFEDLKISQLVRDPFSSYMVAFEDSSCFVFKPNSRCLVDLIDLPRQEVGDEIRDEPKPISAIFIPRSKSSSSSSLPAWQRRSRLVFLNKEQELVQMEDKEEEEEEEEETPDNEDEVEAGVRVKKLDQKTLFGALMMAEERKTDVAPTKVEFTASAVGVPTRAFIDGPLATPAHVLPPVSTLCSQFHALVLGKKEEEEDTESANQTVKDALVNEKEEAAAQKAIRDRERALAIEKRRQNWEEVLSSAPIMDMSWLK